MVLAISFALALLLTTIIMPFAIRYATTLGVVDLPDGVRKVHEEPIPRVGGLAMVAAFFISVLFWGDELSTVQGLLLGACIIAVFGFIDDRSDLDYRWKFSGQILAVLIFVSSDAQITEIPFVGDTPLAQWFAYPVLIFFMLGVTNAVNLSDGLDGLAAGGSLLSFAFIAFLAYGAGEYTFAIVAIAAMGSLLGFLRFNTHPASVFMGDAGSQFLGFVAAGTVILVTQSESCAVSPMLAVVVLGLPILDTLSVIMLRLRDGQSPFSPDKRHLHHQFLAIGLKHYQAVAAIYILSFLLLGVAYLIRYESDVVVLLVYLLFCFVTVGFISFAKHAPVSQRMRQRRALKNERRNSFVRKRLSFMHHHGSVVLQVLLGLTWVAYASLASADADSELLFFSSLLMMLIALVLYLTRFKYLILVRFGFYTASLVFVYSVSSGFIADLPAWRTLNLTDILLGVMALALMLSIRTTRREHFSLNTQDVLVALLIIGAPVVIGGLESDSVLIGDIVRASVLLYVAEYVIARKNSLFVANAFFLMASIISVFKVIF